MKSGLGEHDKVDLVILSSDMQNYMGYTLKKVHAHVHQGCAGWDGERGRKEEIDWHCFFKARPNHRREGSSEVKVASFFGCTTIKGDKSLI